jgi:2-methylcitrate dehydratase PrpD
MADAGMVDEPSLTRRLGGLVAGTAGAALPAQVLERARVSILHNLAVGLAGRPRERVAAVTARQYWAAPAEATLLMDGARVSCEGAAFANAALMNIRSQDDTHAASTSHPGSPTLAAALAVAERQGSSGAAFLAAVVLGYEVLCRAGRDFDERFTARGFRAAALLGGFGAAAAAARLLGLSAEQAGHALGLQANLAGGLAQVWREGSAEAALQIGFGARNGIAAAYAAAGGATAARFALEGTGGFYNGFGGTGAPPAEALAGLGVGWQLEEITVKPLPVCAILQGPAGLFLEMCASRGWRPEAIAAVVVTLNPYEADYPGIDNAGPFASSIATKLSAQFCIGLAAVAGRITPDGLDRVDDPAVLAVAGRVSVRRDAAVAARCCRLEVRLRGGEVLAGAVASPVGQPGFDECARFARGLGAEMGADAAAVERLIAAVAGLEAAADVGALVAAAVRVQSKVAFDRIT